LFFVAFFGNGSLDVNRTLALAFRADSVPLTVGAVMEDALERGQWRLKKGVYLSGEDAGHETGTQDHSDKTTHRAE